MHPIHNIFPSISVPPSSSVILDEKGSVVQGDIGPFNELSTLILTCDVLGGELGRERRNDWIVSGLMKLRVSSRMCCETTTCHPEEQTNNYTARHQICQLCSPPVSLGIINITAFHASGTLPWGSKRRRRGKMRVRDRRTKLFMNSSLVRYLACHRCI